LSSFLLLAFVGHFWPFFGQQASWADTPTRWRILVDPQSPYIQALFTSPSITTHKKNTPHTLLVVIVLKVCCCIPMPYDFYLKQLSFCTSVCVSVLGSLCACAPQLEPIITCCSLHKRDWERLSSCDSSLSMSLNWFASLGLITMRFLAHFVVVVAFCIRVSYLLFGFGFVIALTKQFSVCVRADY